MLYNIIFLILCFFPHRNGTQGLQNVITFYASFVYLNLIWSVTDRIEATEDHLQLYAVPGYTKYIRMTL